MEIINKYKTIIPKKVIDTFMIYYNVVGDTLLEKDILDNEFEGDWIECRTEMLGVGINECKSIDEYTPIVELVGKISNKFDLSSVNIGAIKKWCKTDDEMIKYFEIYNKMLPFEKDHYIFECFESFAPISSKLASYIDSLLDNGNGGFVEYVEKLKR